MWVRGPVKPADGYTCFGRRRVVQKCKNRRAKVLGGGLSNECFSREKRVLTGVQKVLSAKSLYRRYEISTQQYPLLAQSGHALVHCKSPLLGVKRT